jgi:hypothetical protein
MSKFSTRLLFATGFAAALGAGCGGDDDPSTPDAAPPPPTTDAPPAAGCPDHPAVTDMGAVCAITAPDTAPITQNLTLTAGNEYLLAGPVWVGNDTAETILTIEAGVTIYGGDGSFLLIQRHSKIQANGTAAAPIVMTSAKEEGMRAASDWGGLILNGRAPVNYSDPTTGEAEGEAGTGTYGGNVAADNSGTLRYVRVEFAGNKVDAENELNGIAFQGVGSGTTVEYVQTHMTSDDGVEFFGGTVSVKWLVVTGSDDDSIDWTGGWSGNLQFAVAQQLPGSGIAAERGIEADNFEGNHSASPFSDPTLSNLTLIARPEAERTPQGVELRRGTRGELHNSIITGFGGPCLRVSDSQTATNVGDGSVVVNNLVLDCGSATSGEPAAALVAAGNVEVGPAMLTGWAPAAGSPALNIGAGPTGAFFTAVTYAGALDGTTDWTAGWTTSAQN